MFMYSAGGVYNVHVHNRNNATVTYNTHTIFSHVTELQVQFKGGNYGNTLYIHVHAHVAHCTLNMYCIVKAPNIELSIHVHVDHLHTWQ